MVKNSNRLHDKAFKKKFKDSIIQLKKMMDENNISAKQKILLSNVLEEYRLHSTKDTENVLNTEPVNLWGQKDLNSVLKERDDKIFHLQRELEDVKYQNSRMMDDKKRIKIETASQTAAESLEKIVESKNKEIIELISEIEKFNGKCKDLEAQIAVEKEMSEILKDTNKKLSDISTKKQSPVYNRDTVIDSQKYFDLEQEIFKYKAQNAELEKELSISQESCKNLSQQISIMEKLLAGFEVRGKLLDASKINLGDVENELLEELEKITTAYDDVCSTNKTIEQEYSALMKKNTVIQNTNIDLKSKIKILEDSKQFVEKERKRLDELKSTLLEEIKIFEERVVNYNNQILEKDKRINDYKTHIIALQSEIKLLSSEIGSIGSLYRTAQSELINLKNEFKTIDVENKDLKIMCETYKSVCTNESIDIIEDLEKYKRVLKCGLCDSNIKNCVIAKCMHTFCESCLNDRLKARQRKCPNCQTEFTSNDIKKVYF